VGGGGAGLVFVIVTSLSSVGTIFHPLVLVGGLLPLGDFITVSAV
jgi:hypothetical protein